MDILSKESDVITLKETVKGIYIEFLNSSYNVLEEKRWKMKANFRLLFNKTSSGE